MIRRAVRIITPRILPMHLSHPVILSSVTRSFSSTTGAQQQKASDTQLSKKLLEEDDFEDDYDNAKTPAQKLRWFGIMFVRFGFLIITGYCVYITGVELFPGRLGPQNLFNAAFEIVRYNAEVIAMAGEGMRGFGRDVGQHTEGRRNHVEQFKYVGEDGSKRTRIRFNVKGSKGKVQVWAEVSEALPAGELVYLICQDTRTGRVHTIVDNRATLDARGPPAPKPANPFLSLFGSKQ